MAKLLYGAPVAAALDRATAEENAALRAQGIVPKLAIFRVGERQDALSYERAVLRRAERVGMEVMCFALADDVNNERLLRGLEGLNHDEEIHGILPLRPLPAGLDDARMRAAIRPRKDVDGCTDASISALFTGRSLGFAPCTPQAVLELLRWYGIDPAGRRVAVLGRSLVVGRPLAMLLLNANATVTVCHSRTEGLSELTRAADVVITAVGRTEHFGAEYFRPGQTVVDVGVGWSAEKGKLCGDVRFDEVEPIVDAITPVPGGVGSVTSSVLAAHVTEAARRGL